MGKEIAIKVNHVSKNFVLPHERVSSIKNLLTGSSSRRRGSQETQYALKNISFEVKKGEFFGIVGRNGSGKSTLLKILANIYQPTKGEISTNGKLVPFIELGVGFNPELTGRENVYLNGAMLGFSQKEVASMYDDIVRFAELEKFMDQKLKNYSSGMQVRLAFSMATRSNADILLVDEVLAVGDADFQRKCFNYFSKLKNDKTTVVFISHDMTAIREYCDRAMLIEDSEVVDIGPTDKIAEKYLQLFMVEEEKTEEDEELPENDLERWGDKKLMITNVSSSASSKEIRVSIEAKARTDFAKPVVGLRIRDKAGAEITGTNTKYEKANLKNLVKDEVLKLEWVFANVLRDGDYMVDVALQYSDGITVADWWNGASTFAVRKNRRLPYAMDPGFTLNIKS
jgi:ABC-2 type transport system ATP-binding protein